MLAVSVPHRPNHHVGHIANNASTWRVIATDLTPHLTMAAMLTAGKVPWPGIEVGNMTGAILTLRSEDGSGADGGAFYWAMNRGDPLFGGLANDGLRDNLAALISAAGQTRDIEGPFRNLWVRSVAATGEIIADISY